MNYCSSSSSNGVNFASEYWRFLSISPPDIIIKIAICGNNTQTKLKIKHTILFDMKRNLVAKLVKIANIWWRNWQKSPVSDGKISYNCNIQ